MARNFYDILGVSKSADAETIKKAYRKLAKELHPDRNQGNAKVESRFKEVNRAYDVLSDSKKKALYDEFGEDSLREGFDPVKAKQAREWSKAAPFGGADFGGANSAFGASDLFSSLFGGGLGGFRGGSQTRNPHPFASAAGRDLEAEIHVDFLQAAKGTTVTLKTQDEEVSVNIPPGTSDQSKLRVPGHGAKRSPNGPRGDLLLRVHVAPHPFFRREGNDLHLELPIHVSESYLGAKIKIPSLDGPLTLTVPPKTQSKTVMRLKGKGVAKKGKTQGDMYVTFIVHMPKVDSPELRELVLQMTKFEDSELRKHLSP